MKIYEKDPISATAANAIIGSYPAFCERVEKEVQKHGYSSLKWPLTKSHDLTNLFKNVTGGKIDARFTIYPSEESFSPIEATVYWNGKPYEHREKVWHGEMEYANFGRNSLPKFFYGALYWTHLASRGIEPKFEEVTDEEAYRRHYEKNLKPLGW